MNKRQQIIEVLPYNPLWIEQFQTEAEKIKTIFSALFVAIHHIGSTSVPGLAAKPTIDILLEVSDINQVDRLNNQMAQFGYEAWGEYNIQGRRFFVKGEQKRTHHVHTFQQQNPEIKRHLIFRDYLIAHPHEAKQYAELKRQLANKFAENRRAYVLGKSEFVKNLEKKAIAWSNSKKDKKNK